MEIRCKYQLCRRWRKDALLPLHSYYVFIVIQLVSILRSCQRYITDLQTKYEYQLIPNDIPYISKQLEMLLQPKEMGQMHLHQQPTIVYLQSGWSHSIFKWWHYNHLDFLRVGM